MLPDHAILDRLRNNRIRITPIPPVERLQPASVDITLGDTYRTFTPPTQPVTLDDIPDTLTVPRKVGPCGLVLMPGDFILATTAETVNLPDDVCGFLHGRSTLGRLGITVHVTAGLIDPGYHGRITLEVANIGPVTVRLRPGDPVGQLTFEQLDSPAARPYNHPDVRSKYQGQTDVTPPRPIPPPDVLAPVVQLHPGGTP